MRFVFILLLSLLISQRMCSAVVINSSDLNKVSVELISGLFTSELGPEAQKTLRDHWYVADRAETVVAGVKSQMLKNLPSTQVFFGNPQNGVTLLGSSTIGRLISIYYLKSFSAIDVPVKITYVRSGDGYLICGMEWGINLMSEIEKFSVTHIGVIPDLLPVKIP